MLSVSRMSISVPSALMLSRAMSPTFVMFVSAALSDPVTVRSPPTVTLPVVVMASM